MNLSKNLLCKHSVKSSITSGAEGLQLFIASIVVVTSNSFILKNYVSSQLHPCNQTLYLGFNDNATIYSQFPLNCT